MNIALDMMGGDFAPLEAVKGLRDFISKHSNSEAIVFCIGDEAQLNPLLAEYAIPAEKIKLVHAPETIGYHEHPAKALKEKPQSSISIGFHLLATGKVDAFISAGNTGAMLVGTMFSIKPVKGILRPTIATMMPKINGSTGLLLDVGLNADCKPQQLDQFAVLGSIYAESILKINNPRVGLLNIGEEEGKGNLLAQATYPLLKENTRINFTGNVEGRDLVNDKADVVVCDGFTGNVVLKMCESIYDIAESRNLQDDSMLHRFHYETYGGTPILGVAKPVIIGHGISNDVAFINMITLAVQMIETNLCGAIIEAFKDTQPPQEQ